MSKAVTRQSSTGGHGPMDRGRVRCVVRLHDSHLAPRRRRLPSSPLPDPVNSREPDPMETTRLDPDSSVRSCRRQAERLGSSRRRCRRPRERPIRRGPSLGSGSRGRCSTRFLAADRDHTRQLQTHGHGDQRSGVRPFLFPGAEERATAVTRNAELAMGLTGATLGLLLGLAGGLARQSARAGAVAALLGLVLGAAAGAGAALAAVPLASRVHERDPGNMSGRDGFIPGRARPSLGGRRRRRAGWLSGSDWAVGHGPVVACLGGLLGAIAGAFLYEMIGALALPSHQDHRARRRDMGRPLASTGLGGHPLRSRGCGARSLSEPTGDLSRHCILLRMRISVGGGPDSKRAWTPIFWNSENPAILSQCASRRRS